MMELFNKSYKDITNRDIITIDSNSTSGTDSNAI